MSEVGLEACRPQPIAGLGQPKAVAVSVSSQLPHRLLHLRRQRAVVVALQVQRRAEGHAHAAGRRHPRLLVQHAVEPSSRTGTTGTPSRAPIMPMPAWNGLISPAIVRLPSGKISSD